MHTKEEILSYIHDLKNRAREFAKKDMLHSAAFYQTVINVADQFIKDVENTILFERLERGWSYDIVLDYDGFSLRLVHYNNYVNKEGEPEGIIDQYFHLVTTTAPYLNTSQYAKAYGIEETTVRTWIRRGKLRAAERFGNEWKLPVLMDFPRQRGYKKASYSWNRELSGLPEDLEYLNEYSGIAIEQDAKDKKKYIISLYDEDIINPKKKLVLNLAERERFELVLISNKDIHYDARLDEGIMADLMYGEGVEQ